MIFKMNINTDNNIKKIETEINELKKKIQLLEKKKIKFK